MILAANTSDEGFLLRFYCQERLVMMKSLGTVIWGFRLMT